MVVAELQNVIHKCAQKMESFPRLMEECERIASEHTRECEVACKSQLQLMTEIQLSYMNTNHEDFIGFGEASQRANDGSNKRKMGNQVNYSAYYFEIRETFLFFFLEKNKKELSQYCWYI